MIKKYTASNFRGECNVDEDFAAYLDKVNAIAARMGFLIYVTSSGRLDTIVPGAIVVPAKKGNHLVFHAIDFNLYEIATGIWYNSTKLGDGKGPDEIFCKTVVDETGLFWGEAFKTPDSVHMDDRLNFKDPELWQKKYNEIHNLPATQLTA